MIDELEPLLAPISDDAPCGIDVEYEPEFADMEKASQGTPELEFGDKKIEGEPADWNTVRKLAIGLLKRTKDLRVVAYLAEAELSIRGLEGFRDALEIAASYTNDFWEPLYPLLDPDDDNDPTIRLNALARLTNLGGVIRQLRVTPIVRSRGAGIISWTDCAIARGEIPAPQGMEDPPTQKRVDAVVQSCDPNELRRWAQAVEQTLELLKRIEDGFANQVGISNSPDFEPLQKELEAIGRLHKAWVKQFESDEPPPVAATEEDVQVATGSHATHVAAPPPAAIFGSGNPQKRDEAIAALEKIIAWFETNEPSSPVPMLLKRAKRLTSMSFLEILRDISPDGVSQAVIVGGAEAEESN